MYSFLGVCIMRIYGLSANQKSSQFARSTGFKSKFVPNKTLELAFESAEKNNSAYFLSAMKKLMNDGYDRLIEVTGREVFDGAVYPLTETVIKCGDYCKKLSGFPASYRLPNDRMIGVDARILIVELANTVKNSTEPKFLYMTPDTVKKELQELKKEILA